jgi:hypothetical protein
LKQSQQPASGKLQGKQARAAKLAAKARPRLTNTTRSAHHRLDHLAESGDHVGTILPASASAGFFLGTKNGGAESSAG